MKRYLYIAGALLLVALGVYLGRGCAAPVHIVERTHSVSVRVDTVFVQVPVVHVEHIAGAVVYDTVIRNGEIIATPSCEFHAVEKGDTIDARVTGCVLDYLTVAQPPLRVETRDSVIHDSVVREVQRTFGLSGFVETNILHGLSLPDAVVGAEGSYSLANLTLYVTPQFGATTGFVVYAGVTVQIR